MYAKVLREVTQGVLVLEMSLTPKEALDLLNEINKLAGLMQLSPNMEALCGSLKVMGALRHPVLPDKKPVRGVSGKPKTDLNGVSGKPKTYLNKVIIDELRRRGALTKAQLTMSLRALHFNAAMVQSELEALMMDGAVERSYIIPAYSRKKRSKIYRLSMKTLENLKREEA